MKIALRWREEPFDCEFWYGDADGELRVFADGDLIWKEAVRSASLACGRARQILTHLLTLKKQA